MTEAMTTIEAARALGITTDTVRDACIRHAAGRAGLRATKHGRDWVITLDAVEEYRARRRPRPRRPGGASRTD